MDLSYFNVTFDGCGSTQVLARSVDDAMSFGRQFAGNGRTNVRISTPDARCFTLDEFNAFAATARPAR